LKVAVVTDQLPLVEGTAAGRTLWAWCTGARELGHDVEVWSWGPEHYGQEKEIPGWCHWQPFAPPALDGPMWREHLRSMARPRWALAHWPWQPPEGAIAIAEEARSYPAVAGSPRSAVTLHFSFLLDRLALRRFTFSTVQDVRAERRAAHEASVAFAYSKRVARVLGRKVRAVPIGYALPDEVLVPNEEPVASIMADWSWPPNKQALSSLLNVWPDVVAAVPGARLLLAGRALKPDELGPVPGLKVLGEVPQSLDVLSQTSVVAFPCPATSGPKVKVLEALAYGIPVVTTPAGVEGLQLGPGEGALVAGQQDFGQALINALLSPAIRAALGTSGRAAVEKHHSPASAGRARMEVFAAAFGAD
jgi:glycosyltransferase involved in cell wall biosynthesis